MKSVNRAQLYALVPPVVALLVGVGVLTDVQGVAVAGLAVQAVTLGFACYYAAKQKAPITRTVVYGALAALGAAAVAFGLLEPGRVELIIPAAMGVLGLLVAESNTDAPVSQVPVYPGEYSALDRADGLGHDGLPDDDPQRKA